MRLAMVAAGGALGSAARWGVGLAWPHPAATLAVNLIGCAVLGFVVEALSTRHRLLRLFLGPGVLGGFTTFSTYAVETRVLMADGRPGTAVAYALGTLVGALTALSLGMLAARPLTRRRAG
ncbi:fluoride efflux transporter CrcB [Micromonospora sp. CPCC 206061]|uniref:fluoride efflux transporter CrcB n=1 Tax=Micromonospora sp. CPCC 206061 TaxID=3122410 RepID=UPI002FF005CD